MESRLRPEPTALSDQRPAPPHAEPPAAAGHATGAGGRGRPSDHRRRGSVLRLSASIVVAAPLGLLTGPFVARALGPTGRGEVAAATVAGTMTWMAFAMGMPWAIAHRRTTSPGADQALVGSSIRYAFFVLPLATATAVAVVLEPLEDLRWAATAGAVVLMAVAPLNIVTNCQQAMLVAEGALGAMSVLRSAPIIASAVATLTLAATGTLSVATYLATTVIAGLMVNALTWRYLPVRPRGTVPFRPLLSYGARNAGAQLASFGNRALDQAVLAVVVGTKELGVYAVAATIAMAPLSFGQAISARAFGEVALARPRRRRETAERYMRLSLLTGFLGAGAIAVLAPLAVPALFGRQFSDAVVPVLLLLPGTAGLGLGMTGARTLNAIGRPGTATVAEAVALAVTVAGLAVAAGPWGINGAAIVSTIAYWTRNLVQLHVLRREGLGSIRPTEEDALELIRTLLRPIARVRPRRRGRR